MGIGMSDAMIWSTPPHADCCKLRKCYFVVVGSGARFGDLHMLYIETPLGWVGAVLFVDSGILLLHIATVG